MKKSLKKSLAVFLAMMTAMTALFIFPTVASAEDEAPPTTYESTKIAVWADPENVLTQAYVDTFNTSTANTNKTVALGGIQPYQISATKSGYLRPTYTPKGNRYLFLPSDTDCTALKLWLASGSTLTIDNTPITSGEPTDIFAELNAGGVQKTYTFKLNSSSYSVTVMKSGKVGTVYVDTDSGSLSTIYSDKEKSESGTIMVVQPDGTVDYMGALERITGRGNGTWSSDNNKNPYNIKLAKSTSLLGMNKAKKWCLLASTGSGNDNTLVKNQLTYDFADYIGIRHQVHTKPVDLYVNHQYLGSYQLAEKVEIKSNRINITDAYENLQIANGTIDSTTNTLVPADFSVNKPSVVQYNPSSSLTSSTTNLQGHTIGSKNYATTLKNGSSMKNPTDITGGYLYELEISKRWYEEVAMGFCAYNRQGWVVKSADYVTEDMANYNYDLLYALGSAVYNNGVVPSVETTTNCSDLKATTIATYGPISITNPAPAKYRNQKWSDLLDAESAVKYYWTQEFFKNMDSSTSSTYFHKDSDSIDSKIYAGPLWDMDNSMSYNSTASRWGHSYTTTNDWYSKYARIYRWRCGDSSTSYSTDKQSPLNFYAALATNCPDFWAAAEDYWYSSISPAVDILLGRKVDETGKLGSIDSYVDNVELSAMMDAARFSKTYNASTVKTDLKTWVTNRQTWVSSQIPKTSLNSTVVASVPAQQYTGSEITPPVTVKYGDTALGMLTLTEGVDYELSYTNNVNPGTATITVRGINGYTDTASITFSIVANDLSKASLSIESSTYSDVAVTAQLIDSNGNDITDAVSYQWYKNGTAISNATDKTYLTSDADKGAELYVVASGEQKKFVNTATSNTCTVLTQSRPTGFAKTIASWDYDYQINKDALVNADTSGTDYYYTATGGEQPEGAKLYGTVDNYDPAVIEWSGKSDLFANDSVTDGTGRSPKMGTSKTDLVAWGEAPYFETTVSTLGYENISFSAKLGGTNKGPSTWKLQYSLDGNNFTDIDGTLYTITANKTMDNVFDNVSLPAECDNQSNVYIRMCVAENRSIAGATIVDQLSGDAAVNNIAVKGSSLKVISSLEAPVITADSTMLFDDNKITITDSNGGADVYYRINGGEEIKYTAAFNPFDAKTAKLGDTAVITAYAHFNDITSSVTTQSYTFGGVNINSFIFDDFSDNAVNGAVQSNGGVYGKSGRMTTYTDGKAQYPPLWRADNGSFCIAPDDGALWTADSGFTYKISTAGYENVAFSCMAYTTNSGPKSVSLQYSIDNGATFYNVVTNVPLTANGMLENLFVTADLPAACDNQREVLIRLATTENSTFAGVNLHNNLSKGNLYVNNVVISGEDNGQLKMPYTNKSTEYFGSTGTITFKSPDGAPMQYAVIDSKGNTVQSGTYPQAGIQLSTVKNFDKCANEKYTILIQAEDDEDSSITNAASYRFKGDTVVEFNYNSTTRPFANYISDDALSISSTGGDNMGTLSMYPNGKTATTLTSSDVYTVKAEWNLNNKFVSNKTLNKVDGNGYWLIETSTKGYTDLTLSLEQVSSNKGPRDWGIAYSTDGRNFTYVADSNARAVSNDAFKNTTETYGNIALGSACDDQDKLYIKIFINGGESVDGTELDDISIDRGNTGIDNIELTGIKQPINVNFTTTLLENAGDISGNTIVAGVDIYVNGSFKATTDSTGKATVAMPEGQASSVELKGSTIATRTIEITADSAAGTQNVAVMAYDVNADGYVNAKDFAIISKKSKYSSYRQFFPNFINTKTDEFVY